jgi:hypothetical protein
MCLRRVVRGHRICWDLVEGVRDRRTGKVTQKLVTHLGRDGTLCPTLDSLRRSLVKLAESPLLDPTQAPRRPPVPSAASGGWTGSGGSWAWTPS